MTAALLTVLALSPAADVDFARDVRPLFAAKCVSCHGPKRQEGGLRLDLRSRARQGGDSGPALSKSGELLHRVRAREDEQRMPPGDQLSDDEIGKLQAWIDKDAPWPDALAGKDAAANHWSFRPVKRTAPPAVRDTSWLRQPIDAFVLARLEKERIVPSPEAGRRTLVRRLYLDLIGLPPTPGEVEAFVSDRSPDAYEKVVDRLLSSPHFGERWGRHWLDLCYAESDGYENDRIRGDAWRWRDWVVRSYNADQPYDAFTVEQLAGDLLAEATLEQKLATGLHRNTLYNSAASGDKEEFRTYAIKDRAETTATAWMGLTLGCASCHSHKYDPVSIREYYSFYAFFNATDHADLPVPGVKGSKTKIPTLKAAARETHVFVRGSFLRRGAKVEPDTPAFLPPLKPRGKLADRLDVARWLTRSDHPLTARVAANHVWQHLFGAGLVASPENFGTSGERPSHPELLDWLADEFVRSGWSRKALVRTVVLSATYRQASTHRRELKEKDPDNRLLARQNRFRVEAEVVHDLALSAAGLLQTQLGGPSFVPPFPRELPVTQFTQEALKQPTKQRHRRGLYVHVQRTLTHPLLGAFDATDGNQPCARRARSSTAVQALTMLNDPTFVEAARSLGERLTKADEGERLTLAFRLTLGRDPGKQEAAILKALIEKSRQRKAKEETVWAGVARVLLNLEEFTTRE